MKITQEKLPASQVGLEIEVPSDVSQRTYEDVIQKFTRSLNIPGFRKGKVPRHVLLQRLGATQIKQAALEQLIQAGFSEALKETAVDAIGNPDLKPSFDELVAQYQPGEALTFTAIVDVRPEVTLKQYQGFQVKAEEVAYDSGKVDAVLEDYRVRVATLIPVEDRPAQEGDTAIIDYHGRLTDVDTSEDPDAAEFQGNQAQDFQVELEEGRFIAGFIEGIVGMQVGESKDVTVPFPEDYTLETVAGKNATFSITLKELKAKELPDLDDDFAQDISEFDTLAELRASLEERYQQEAENETRQNKEQALVDALLEQVEVELPETMIRQEVDSLITQTMVRLQQQGLDVKQLLTPEMVTRFREQSRGDAILSLKRSLALAEIAKQESIEASAEAIQSRSHEIRQSAQAQGQAIDEDRLRQVVVEDLITEQVLSWLIEHSEVELVPPGTLNPPETALSAAEPELNEPEAAAEKDTQTIDVAVETVEPEDEPEAQSKTTKKSTSTTKGRKKSPTKKKTDDDA